MFYLVNYSVKGIKTLDKLITLSFYKKIVNKDVDIRNYNIKGIYGENGSGKTGIVTSVLILKNLILDSNYLNNPNIQNMLKETINKKNKELFIRIEYISDLNERLIYNDYSITISLDMDGNYAISKEKLSIKEATSRKQDLDVVFEVNNGRIVKCIPYLYDDLEKVITSTTTCLLKSTLPSLLFDTVHEEDNVVYGLNLFATKLHVYLENSDNQNEYLINRNKDISVKTIVQESRDIYNFRKIVKGNRIEINALKNYVLKDRIEDFEEEVKNLYEFIHIFKKDLKSIMIDKKEIEDYYICNLLMVYDSYEIHSEYESTGIKKLIRLFSYFIKMKDGDIVFTDELDANLHDVYLCALLEYLKEYGKGQLCFTTHNVGPMDVLKQNKKSIEFLSVNHNVYSWANNGNYSPSKLYRSGMIEGSPFNVESIDFLKVFGVSEGDE